MPDQPPDENDLIVRARAGDREAFSGLVALHQGRLRVLAATWLNDPADAWDVVQDAFLDAWRALHTYDPARPFGPWLRTICRHRCVRALRQRARSAQPLAAVDAALGERLEQFEDPGDTRLTALRGCLDGLQPAQRRLIERRYGDGVAVQTLADEQGRSPNALSMVLLRLREALERCVGRRLAEDA